MTDLFYHSIQEVAVFLSAVSSRPTRRSDLLKSVQEVARGVSFGVSFSLLRSDLSSRGTTPTAQNTALVLHSVVRRDTRSPFRDQEVGGSNPLAPTHRRRSVLDTWVTVYSEHIGNTFGPKGFSIGSRRQVSSSK